MMKILYHFKKFHLFSLNQISLHKPLCRKVNENHYAETHDCSNHTTNFIDCSLLAKTYSIFNLNEGSFKSEQLLHQLVLILEEEKASGITIVSHSDHKANIACYVV
ncbi:hypothetical protein MtrunA17_Chr3g0097661 [Medicago truncatula]|uniref:Uncharacterized protein n=1 Tax=Medicago truncatula TaxID=3880 RepID=G7IZX2_MEDTR|nr:hypothetical protein MTR_3g048750 [Medicago truncatula]RHN66975.1 hypothetical protein MtrunA17_Chr3g0097661 [Medicago truncatula]